ncbi:MAG: SusC/RagA family TonB-linked outer membrane protein [Mucilaginibacter sp.]
MKRIFTISGLVLLCLFLVNIAFAQNVTLRGKVTDATTGESLVGVSVVVKGTQQGTQTDVSGVFTISAAPNATLVFSYIGYTTQQVTAAGAGNLVSVKLLPAASELQQVVVIGYGTQKKVDNTGSVATVKGADVAKEASQNALSSLQGKVAGLNIINNGAPGASPQVTIRGIGTIGGATNPLYVVDGVWYDDISFLNTADIDNVTVLKDASSTAIYGIRGSNGVIVINTRRGGKGKPVINYNGYVGWQKATNLVPMANATEYATAIDELYQYNNVTPVLFSDPSSFGTGTNWYDQILRNAFVTNHTLSISGGSEHNVYNVSFGYLDQDGLVKTNNYQRYTVHISDDWTVVKPLKIGFTLSGLSSESRDINGGIFHQLYGAAPTLPVYYNTGAYGDPADYHTGDGNNYNPEATIDFYNQHSRNKRLTGNVYGELTLFKDLKFKTSFGGDVAQAEVRNYTPVYYATLAQQSQTSSLDIQHTQTRNWIWENTLTYDKTINDHHITALAGMTAQDYTTYFAHGYAQNVPYVANGSIRSSYPDSVSNAFQPVTPNEQPHTRQLSYFGRINYSYKDKYLLNASIREDGASNYYGNNGKNVFGYFPSIGGGWVISNEDFMKNQNIFSDLKLRASWGRVGNSTVPVNLSNVVVTSDPGFMTAIFGNPQQYYQGASINTVVPPATFWENAESTDVGLEASFLHNKLYVEADYYNRTTENAIFAIPIPASVGTGGGNIVGNQAKINNRGAEFVVTWKDKPSKDFSYSVSANLGTNANKVVNVISGKNPIYSGGNGIANGALATRIVEGEPIGEFYGYKVVGVFQNTAQIAASKQPTALPGDFIYQDTNGDGSIDSRDKVVLGNPNPKYNYGINTSFTYKHFDLELDMQGVADVSVYNANIAYRYGNENFTKDFYDHRWHGAGTSNTYPSVNVGANANAAPNSFYVESGAYFRLRNAQLGYTFPAASLNKYGIEKIRVFANAQNALNIFGYKGFNPEVGGGVGNLGLDANVYPLYATYNFGVNVTFK